MAKKRTTKPVKAVPIKEETRVIDAVQQLRNLGAEHFDVGVILLSREVEGQTTFHAVHWGNEFAAKGVVENYVENYMEGCNSDWEGEWADEED